MYPTSSSSGPTPAASANAPLSDEQWDAVLACLRTIDYPARRDDLLRVAVVDHLPVPCVEALRDLPDRSFVGMFDVVRELRARSSSPARRLAV